jgi:hypothetical protein
MGKNDKFLPQRNSAFEVNLTGKVNVQSQTAFLCTLEAKSFNLKQLQQPARNINRHAFVPSTR